MKFCRLLLLLVFLLQNLVSLAQQNIDVLHYKFVLQLNDNNDTIVGTTDVRLRFIQPADSFQLDLASQNESGKGMKVDRVTASNDLKFLQKNDKLIIYTKPGWKNADSATFTIDYRGIPADGLIISKNKYGERTFFGDNWPNRAHHWLPCKDEPDDKATFEFMVTAPSHYQVISNGRLEGEKELANDRKLTHWIEDVALPTKVMVIGAAKFAVKEFGDSPPKIPVSAWVYPKDSAIGFRNYAPATAIVKFYSGYIGPYPYNKLANVQSKTNFGGMENASAIFYNEQSAEQNHSIEDLLAHEIAHQWFGDMATEKSFPHLWLSEGFATYLSDIYLESRYGTVVMNNRLKEERTSVIAFTKSSGKPVVDSVSPVMKLLSPNSYERGGWVLHMLRRQIGDSAFQTVIRRYYDRYKGKNADTDDFRKVVEEVTARNFEQFFKQWLRTREIPQLSIQSQYNKKNEELVITVMQLQNPIFQFPLQFAIESELQKEKTVTVQVSKQTETFKFKVHKKLVRFTVDPNTALLFEEVKGKP